MESLDKLRNVSRTAYLVDIAFNTNGIFTLSKLVDSLQDMIKAYKKYKSIKILIDKLDENVRNKISIIKDFGVLSYQIDNISRKIPLGIHPLEALEADTAKRREIERNSLFIKTPQYNFSRNSLIYKRGDTVQDLSLPFEALRPRNSFMAKDTGAHNNEMDLRRIAIENSIKGLNSDSPFKEPQKTVPNQIIPLIQPIERLSDVSLSETSPKQTPSSNLTTPNSDTFNMSVSFTTGGTKLNTSSRSYAEAAGMLARKNTFPLLPDRKPFDKTLEEEQIEAIFKDIQKPIIRRISFAEELLMDHEFEADQRLNNSCALDYALENWISRNKSSKRCLSMPKLKNIEVDGFITPSKSKKYFQILLLLIQKRVSIDDFQILKGLSSGAYGKVCLAKKKSSGDYFALKMIDREKTIAKDEEDYIMSEVNILRNLDSEYIVKLYYSFQDDDYLYFVMEYMNGGDLGNLLSNCGCVEEKYAKNYLAEIVLSLEYLHSKNINHRDMKPENILIDSKGHLKLTDFGLSQSHNQVQHKKWIETYLNVRKSGSSDDEPKSHKKTYEKKPSSEMGKELGKQKKKKFVGTPHYLAPEIISEQKASFAADWWAVGVIMFEMMVGSVPFSGNTPDEVFENILKNRRDCELDIGYNDNQISPDAADLINGLLEHNPEKRLGTKNGAKEIKAHPFFQGTNWEGLLDEEPPFVPEPMVDPTAAIYFNDKKQFKVTDIIQPKPQSAQGSRNKERKSILGFDFDTLNVGSLAQKNKDAFKGVKANKMLKRTSFAVFDYEQDP